jgi:CBS domain-containing protein
MQIEAILSSKGKTVYTVPTNARVADAVAMLNKHNIGAVVVIDSDGEVAGILSERDVVRLLGRDADGALKRPVSECMTANVITCSPETTVAVLMEQMTRFRIRHIPIVANGRLAGIVSIGDVVKRKIEEAEQEASALREYIAT